MGAASRARDLPPPPPPHSRDHVAAGQALRIVGSREGAQLVDAQPADLALADRQHGCLPPVPGQPGRHAIRAGGGRGHVSALALQGVGQGRGRQAWRQGWQPCIQQGSNALTVTGTACAYHQALTTSLIQGRAARICGLTRKS